MMIRTHYVALFALLLAGCTLTGPGSSELTELEEARQTWQNLGLDNYDLQIVRGCFCIGAGAMTVMVRDDSVAAVIQAEEWSAQTDWWQHIPTVDDLFALIEDAKENAASFDVQYSIDGYPTQIDIDWITDAVDDEITYTVSKMTPTGKADNVTLSLGQSHEVEGASISFSAVDEESRCATGTVCIWAGRAIISIDLALDHETVTLRLVDGATRENDSRTGAAGPVRVTLVRVAPYPKDGTTVPFSEYQVQLLIESS